MSPRPNSGARYSLDMGKIQPLTRGGGRSAVAVAWFGLVHRRRSRHRWGHAALDDGLAFGGFHAGVEQWHFGLILLRRIDRAAINITSVVAGPTRLAVAALSAVIAVTALPPVTPVTAPAFLAVVAAAALAVAVIAALLIVPILLLGHIGAEDQWVFERLWWELVLGRATPAVAAPHDRRGQMQAQIVLGKLVVGLSRMWLPAAEASRASAEYLS